jgi:hypothetical protein
MERHRMDAFWKKLAGFIVDALFAKLGIKDLNDLLAKASAAFKAEMSDELAKLDNLPVEIAKELGDIPAQVIAHLPDFVGVFRGVINQAMARLPFPFNQFQI